MAKEGRKAGVKTQSQELREVFFKLFTKNPEEFVEFDDYYSSKMQKLIIHYKKMLQ